MQARVFCHDQKRLSKTAAQPAALPDFSPCFTQFVAPSYRTLLPDLKSQARHLLLSHRTNFWQGRLSRFHDRILSAPKKHGSWQHQGLQS